MTDQEQINVNIQRQIDAQNARIDTVLAKVDMVIGELRQQREDIRRAQEKHDADMKEMNQRFYAKFDATDAKIDALRVDMNKGLHNNFVQTMLGVGAMMVALGGLLIAVLK